MKKLKIFEDFSQNQLEESITTADIVDAIKDELSNVDIDVDMYETEIHDVAKRIMEEFKQDLAYISEKPLFLYLLEELRDKEGL
jgi:GMP synthase PP-ATPase subunit